MNHARGPATPRGYTLLEVLVSLIVLAVGLIGLAALHTRVRVAEMESYQRSQALVLMQDMVDRITNNASALRSDINKGTASTVYKTVLPTDASAATKDVGATTQDCTGMTGAALDLCEWGNEIAGAGEKAADSSTIGTLTNGRGCVRQPDPNDPYLYMVAVSWQGRIDTKAPPSSVDCGSVGTADSPGYTSATKRRAVALTVRITNLSAP